MTPCSRSQGPRRVRVASRTKPPNGGTPSPNNRLNVAVIGAGGRGGAALVGLKDENIVAVCDVDQERADGSLKSFAGRYAEEARKYEAAPRFNDYRKMFDAVGNKID